MIWTKTRRRFSSEDFKRRLVSRFVFNKILFLDKNVKDRLVGGLLKYLIHSHTRFILVFHKRFLVLEKYRFDFWSFIYIYICFNQNYF